MTKRPERLACGLRSRREKEKRPVFSFTLPLLPSLGLGWVLLLIPKRRRHGLGDIHAIYAHHCVLVAVMFWSAFGSGDFDGATFNKRPLIQPILQSA